MRYVSNNAENLPRFVPAGDYLLTVLEAAETVSQNGTEMIKLKLEVEGHGVRLFDYLVASESSYWKIDTFRKAIGEAVTQGEEVELVAANLEGRQGYARLRIEDYQGKRNNKVDMWLTKRPATRPASPKPATATAAAMKEDGDEPF
jgi:hypothetical protein